MQKIVVASDSFKGCLSSKQVADSVETGIHDVFPDCAVLKLSVADGGEGTMEALRQTLGGTEVQLLVSDPLGRLVESSYVVLNDGITAVVEMSVASGITLLKPSELDPLKTSTRGTGEIIADALERGCRRFLIGIGGSATNDAGTGMLEALGYRFLDKDGHQLKACGGALEQIVVVDQSGAMPELTETEFIVACDVKAPLYGPDGAAYVYAPQKGADADMVEQLDRGLRHFAELLRNDSMAIGNAVGRTFSCVGKYEGRTFEYGDKSFWSGDAAAAAVPGAGAAGGLGFGFIAFLNARLQSGADMVLDAVGFDAAIPGADLVITGEGRIDAQTLSGKLPFKVAERAALQNIPVIALCGQNALGDYSPFACVCQITPSDIPLEDTLLPSVASQNIRTSVAALLRTC